MHHTIVFFSSLWEINTEMLNALKLARPLQQVQVQVQLQVQQPSFTSFSLSRSNPNHTPQPSLIRFARTAAGGPVDMDSNKQSDTEPKKKNDPQSKPRDTMSSFGEGYATRSDEEGFGGTYGGNQYLSKEDDDKNEFDHTQGSHVKEQEHSRNQKKAQNE